MSIRSAKIDQKADLIWAIADKLTGPYKPHEYGDVILPLTVIRRFDCILSNTKDAVLKKYEEVKNLPMKDVLLRKASGFDFYNTSKYTFEKLMDDPDHIEENFRDYLNGFSDNADFGYTKITVERPQKDEDGNVVLKKGKPVADTALRDTENVPLKEDIKKYFEREVLPFAPDAWIDEKKSKVGYEIPFTRYFYKYEAPRPSEEIMAEIMELEKELSGSLEEVFR